MECRVQGRGKLQVLSAGRGGTSTRAVRGQDMPVKETRAPLHRLYRVCGYPTAPLRPLVYPHGFSVVVPCLDCADTIAASLQSFLDAAEHVAEVTISKQLPIPSVEIIVVDDASKADTAAKLKDLAQNTSDHMTQLLNRATAKQNEVETEAFSLLLSPPRWRMRVVTLDVNVGAGRARNAGVKQSTEPLICYGEADDLFLPHHLTLAWSMWMSTPNHAFIKTRMEMGEERCGRDERVGFDSSPACGGEGFKLAAFHPYWQTAVEDTSPLNMCVRREAHIFTGGYPEGEEWREDMEDGFFAMALHEVYAGAKSMVPSVRYIRRPGNSLDKRMPQFTSSPGTHHLNDFDSKYYGTGDQVGTKALIDVHLLVLRDRVAEYQDLVDAWGTNPFSLELTETQTQRMETYGHLFPVLRSSYPSGQPLIGVALCGRERKTFDVLGRLLFSEKDPHAPHRIIVFACTKRVRTIARMFPVHVISLNRPRHEDFKRRLEIFARVRARDSYLLIQAAVGASDENAILPVLRGVSVTEEVV